MDILKKINGIWTIVYTSKQPPSKAIEQHPVA